MSKEPMVTRSELRKRREELEANQARIERQAKKAYQKEEKNIDNIYRKKRKEQVVIEKTRTGEKEKSRQMSNFLMKWIVIVSILIVIVMLITFFL
ncbi:cell wall synthase accessory phosphoprotein MacP [Enterococcus eurekensis]|uniref:Cell wall synthase accessory phosphoprotein MacP n=1 Tax=Enterococcus eurekensis TaxID=1159753 RepID=A0ABV9M5U7_9ENTE